MAHHTSVAGRVWRTLATAIAFATFGLGGLLLRVVYFPALGLAVRDQARRARLARLAVHRSFRLFVEWMRVLGILSYEITGLERLNRAGLLILANHPTLLDVVFLIALIPNADCVVKASLASNPFTRGPVCAANYICNDSGADLVWDCISALRAGSNLIIFPEGTRTPLGGSMKLQRGAANIAVRGVCDMTPVRIRCTPLSLSKGEPWWRVPPSPMHFVIAVQEDIPIADFVNGGDTEAPQAARTLTQHLHQYFSQENARYADARA